MRATPTRLDLDPGCVDEICLAPPCADAVEAWGDPESCYLDAAEQITRGCTWPDNTVGLNGSTEAGLGAAISLQCWVDHYGAPEAISWSDGTLGTFWYDDRSPVVANSYLEGDGRPDQGFVAVVTRQAN